MHESSPPKPFPHFLDKSCSASSAATLSDIFQLEEGEIGYIFSEKRKQVLWERETGINLVNCPPGGELGPSVVLNKSICIEKESLKATGRSIVEREIDRSFLDSEEDFIISVLRYLSTLNQNICDEVEICPSFLRQLFTERRVIEYNLRERNRLNFDVRGKLPKNLLICSPSNHEELFKSLYDSQRSLPFEIINKSLDCSLITNHPSLSNEIIILSWYSRALKKLEKKVFNDKDEDGLVSVEGKKALKLFADPDLFEMKTFKVKEN